MQKELEKRSKFSEINDDTKKQSSGLEKFNVDQTSEN